MEDILQILVLQGKSRFERDEIEKLANIKVTDLNRLSRKCWEYGRDKIYKNI